MSNQTATKQLRDGKFQQRNWRCKEELNRNFSIDKHTHKTRNPMDDLNSRIKRIEERIGKLTERTIEITQHEQLR